MHNHSLFLLLQTALGLVTPGRSLLGDTVAKLTLGVAIWGIALAGCSSPKESKPTQGTGQLDQSVVPSDGSLPGSTHMGGRKFLGEYHEADGNTFRIVLREAKNPSGEVIPDTLLCDVFYLRKKPLTLRFFYDPQKDLLSNRWDENTPSYSLMRLHAGGEGLMEIYFHQQRVEPDTMMYIRHPKAR